MTLTAGRTGLADAATGDGQRVALHLVMQYGARSQTFIPQLIRDLDELGWYAWVASPGPRKRRSEFPFPPDHRFVRPLPAPLWRRAAARVVFSQRLAVGAAALRPSAERLSAAVVHAHFGWAAAGVDVESIGAPFVVSFHGTDVRAWPHRSRRNARLFSGLIRGLRWAIASSHSIAGEVRSHGYQGRLEVIPAGVQLDRFSFRLPRTTADDPRLLFVGRQVPCKGVPVLLTALPEIAAQHPGVTLTVVGDGVELRTNRQLARRLGIAKRVTFRGSLPHAAVAEEMQRADMLVVPSRRDDEGQAEGHPVVPKEGYATGLPVVATDCGGLPEVVPPSFRGEIIPQDDSAAVARAVKNLLAEPESWPERGAEGRRWVEEQFDTHLLAGRVADLYAEMTGEDVAGRS